MYEDARKDLVKCHNAECDFLEYFRDIPGVPLPAVYYARRLESDLAVSGVIIIEDLSEKRHIGGFVQSPNDTQVRLRAIVARSSRPCFGFRSATS